ncbi:terminase small subunit [Arthrobacter sp. AL12]|uniref:terminase small subunit n=1 Tax=Arthrobacter sp. AL12 TaxID=3042241 RepID=UPI00249AC681|nr:terminase small subunit [Arthrobacter sp. AL12]MDI3211775.1 terminase small subunit [Arthrobacter sp. AL12]
MADTDSPEQPAEKNKGGRPLKFKTVDELQVAIDSYFDACDPHLESRLVESGINERGETIFAQRKVMTEQKPYTVSGLARALGITRETLVQYKNGDRFSDPVMLAYERCHEWAENALYSKSASGASFSLKNNWGWKERQEIDHTTDGKPMQALVEIVRSGDQPSKD